MKAYYAHCTAIYNTPQENRDVAELEEAGYTVVNPNSPAIAKAVTTLREDFAALREGAPDGHLTLVRRAQLAPFANKGQAVMELIFKPLAQSSGVLVFRSLPDGRIPAGVAQEIEWAREAGIPVLELPSRMTGRTISVEETCEYLKEIGQQ